MSESSGGLGEESGSDHEQPIVGNFPDIDYEQIVREGAERIKDIFSDTRAKGELAFMAIKGYIKDNEGNVKEGEVELSSEDEIEIGASDKSGAEIIIKNKGIVIAATTATLLGLGYGAKKIYEIRKKQEDED